MVFVFDRKVETLSSPLFSFPQQWWAERLSVLYIKSSKHFQLKAASGLSFQVKQNLSPRTHKKRHRRDKSYSIFLSLWYVMILYFKF